MLRPLLYLDCFSGSLWTAQVLELTLWDSEFLNRKSNTLKRLTRAFSPFQLSVFQDSRKYICSLSLPYNYHLPVIRWRNFFGKVMIINAFCDYSTCSLAQVIVPGFSLLSLYMLTFISLPLARQLPPFWYVNPCTLPVPSPHDCNNLHPIKPLTLCR